MRRVSSKNCTDSPFLILFSTTPFRLKPMEQCGHFQLSKDTWILRRVEYFALHLLKFDGSKSHFVNRRIFCGLWCGHRSENRDNRRFYKFWNGKKGTEQTAWRRMARHVGKEAVRLFLIFKWKRKTFTQAIEITHLKYNLTKVVKYKGDEWSFWRYFLLVCFFWLILLQTLSFA